jgi:3'-phosphoadenosine 5'-phosphosulfate sulfotransferase (PAPS reductase)/FAD synthetase
MDFDLSQLVNEARSVGPQAPAAAAQLSLTDLIAEAKGREARRQQIQHRVPVATPMGQWMRPGELPGLGADTRRGDVVDHGRFDPMKAWRRLGGGQIRTGKKQIGLKAFGQAQRRKFQQFVPDMRFYDAIIVNTSAGKDSIAMTKHVTALAERQGVRDRLLMVHADLGSAEWEGTAQLAQQHAVELGLPFQIVANQMTLLQRIEEMGMMPEGGGADARYCTGEFKTVQVSKLITNLVRNLRTRGSRPARILQVLGMRAAEGGEKGRRAGLPPFSRPKDNRNRLEDRWLPIHGWSDDQVWDSVEAGPLRPPESYACGMSRHSCKFCIMAAKPDLVNAALLDPVAAQQYVALETRMSDPRGNPWHGDVVQYAGAPVTVIKRQGRKVPGATVTYQHAGRQRTIPLEQWRVMTANAQVVSLGPTARRRLFPVMPMSQVVEVAQIVRGRGADPDPRVDPQAARQLIEAELGVRRRVKHLVRYKVPRRKAEYVVAVEDALAQGRLAPRLGLDSRGNAYWPVTYKEMKGAAGSGAPKTTRDRAMAFAYHYGQAPI